MKPGIDRNLAIAIFSAADENIRHCKNHQWQTAVYVITIQSLLAVARETLKFKSYPAWPFFALGMILFAGVIGCCLLLQLQGDLGKYRSRQHDIEGSLQLSSFLSANAPGKHSWILRLLFASLFCSTLVTGWGFATEILDVITEAFLKQMGCLW